MFVGGERAERDAGPGCRLRAANAAGRAAGPAQHSRRSARCDDRCRRRARRPAPAALRAPRRGARGGRLRRPVRSASAAAVSRIPLVLMEADSHLGLTNRMLAPVARRVCLSFPIDGRDGRRYRLTGRPVPEPVTDRDGARARFGIGADEQCVLVFGGSQGARSINKAAIEAFAGARFRVLHAAGERDLPDLDSARAALRPARLHLGLRPGAARPATWSSRAPADRCSRSPRTGARWC